jgi:hemin uptake protein HemP
MSEESSTESSTLVNSSLTKPVAIGTLCHPINSESLFGASREVYIRHGEELYRLTITRNDKLILQK